MEPLLIEEISFEKSAGFVLSGDSSTWSKQVLGEFYETFPFMIDYPAHLNFKSMDERKGFAVGSISIGQDINIPVIVQDFNVSPFDVAYVGGAPTPFTAETVASLFKNPTAYKQLQPSANNSVDASVFGVGRQLIEPSPSYENRKTASHEEYTSVLDGISGSISKVAQEKVLNEINNSAAIKAGFQLNDTACVVEKLASFNIDEEKDYRKILSDSLERDVIQITKLGYDRAQVRLANKDVYDPITLTLESDQLNNLSERFAAENTKLANYDYEDYAVVNTEEGRTFLVDSFNGQYRELDQTVKTAGDLNNISTTVARGDTGFLKIGEKVYGPVTVEQCTWDSNGNVVEFDAMEGLNKVAFAKVSNVDTRVEHSSTGVNYIPRDTEFLKLGSHLDIDELKVKDTSHRASFNFDATYTLTGPTFSKFASEHNVRVNSLASNDAEWIVMQCGGSREDVENIKTANFGREVCFSSDLSCPRSLESLNEELKSQHSEKLEKAACSALNLIKEASVIPDKTTVDAVLSLGMLSSKNVAEFVEYIPQFELCAQTLANLLISVRMGLRVVPEEAVKSAMEGLAVVVETLRAVQAMMKPVK